MGIGRQPLKVSRYTGGQDGLRHVSQRENWAEAPNQRAEHFYSALVLRPLRSTQPSVA